MPRQEEPFFVDAALLRNAEQACRKRLERDPNNRRIIRSLAEIYRKQGNLPEAGETYRRLAKLDPQDESAAYLHAVLAGRELPTGRFRASRIAS
jgi:tetratricopeptide (TPR) repeat protein